MMLVRSINVKPSVTAERRQWQQQHRLAAFFSYRESELKTILLSSGIKCIEFHLWHCTAPFTHSTHAQLADWLTDLRKNEMKWKRDAHCAHCHTKDIVCSLLGRTNGATRKANDYNCISFFSPPIQLLQYTFRKLASSVCVCMRAKCVRICVGHESSNKISVPISISSAEHKERSVCIQGEMIYLVVLSLLSECTPEITLPNSLNHEKFSIAKNPFFSFQVEVFPVFILSIFCSSNVWLLDETVRKWLDFVFFCFFWNKERSPCRCQQDEMK